MKIRILLAGLVLTVAGCSSVSQGGYYWGNYSVSYFEMVKDRSPETIAKRISALEEIIEQSEERDLRVPPGIYAELGMFFVEDGRKEDGMVQFENEIAVYPESKPFIERLVSRLP
jgi:hypothetical protein